MVEHYESLNPVFHALADPTRRQLLASLAERPRPVGELAEPFAMSLAAVSKHLDTLERAGLVVREKRGRQRLCRLTPAPLAAASDWLSTYARFWNARLDALDAALKEDDHG